MLEARTRAIDLDKADIVCSRVPEFALFFNATGAAIPVIEHFLSNVMNEVRHGLAGSARDLARELEGCAAPSTIPRDSG